MGRTAKKISQLADGGTPQSGDEFPIERGNANFRLDWDSIVAAAASAVQGTFLDQALNLSDLPDVPTARANLGLGSAALLSAATLMLRANNLSDVADVPTARGNLGLGSAALLASAAVAKTASNLSDLADIPTARTNLGLGSMAVEVTGNWLSKAGNLAGLADLPTSRTNIGLGTGDSPVFTAVRSGDGTASVAGIQVGAANFGLYRDTGSGRLVITNNGSIAMAFFGGFGILGSVGVLGWTAGAATASVDTQLLRDASGVIAQYNGANGQVFRLYNTRTDASNYERGFIGWESNAMVVGCDPGLGTGSNARVLKLRAMSGSTGIEFQFGTTTNWKIATGSNTPLQPSSNATADFGTSSTQIRNAYIAGGLKILTKAGAVVDSDITGPIDGMIAIDTTNSRLYARIGGAWKSVVLA